MSAEIVFLVPDHARRSGRLAEDRAAPEQEIGTQQRGHALDDRRVAAELVERPATQVMVSRRREPIDRGRLQERLQDGRIALGHLLGAERRERSHEAVALEVRELLRGEALVDR